MAEIIKYWKIIGKNTRYYYYFKDGNCITERLSKDSYNYFIEKYKDYAVEIKYDIDNSIVEMSCFKGCEFLMYNSDIVKTYFFQLKTSKRILNTSFQIVGKRLLFNCSCEKGRRKETCWHVKHILSGRIEELISTNLSELDDLILKSENTGMGEKLIFFNQLQTYKYNRGIIK